MGDEEFFEACDRYGIMVWEDFWLANPWDGPDPYHEDMFMANARDFIRRLRQHPCMALYVGRNEGYPPQSLDQNLRQAIAELYPQLGYIPNSAADGVIGGGRYRNMPVDWYFANQTHKLHSERGMASVPSLESVTRMLAPDELWPVGEAWGRHDLTLGGAVHATAFNEILDGYWGRPQNVRQFISWGLWVNYDVHRVMFKGEQQFRKGLLMWMSHPCWPSMVWQAYDYYLEPTVAFFAIRKACEPLHLQYNSEKNTIEVVDIAAGPHKVKAIAEYYDMNGQQMAVDGRDVTIGEDQTITVMEGRKPLAGSHEVWFLRLKLLENDKQLTENTYMLSNPAGHFEALKEQPEARVKTVSHFTRKGEGWQAVVTLTNQSDVPALMVRLNLKGTDGGQVLPVSYSDNYFHLMPHENKSVTLSWKEEYTRGCKPRIEVTTFN